MNDAPERIWAWEGPDDRLNWWYAGTGPKASPRVDVEYIRADIHRAEVERLEAQVPRWISVEERLPEKSTRCLICGVTGRQFVSGFDRLWGFYDAMFKVTHWMPLPEPPAALKEQTDD